MRISTAKVVEFHKALTASYYRYGRHDMLWRQPDSRGHFDPYKILVSELMLQQTQVDRVTPKYVAFLEKFPDVEKLASAELGDVLKLWNGLGYNRRAKYIWQAAQSVMQDYQGHFPETVEDLKKLPGVGPNTAGAIVAYAYDQPVLFIETNVRTVIIHHFFKDKADIPDSAILEVLKAIAPHPNTDKRAIQGGQLGPRQFYWAMMDYGTFLKKSVGNLNRASRHYGKQSKFHGSKRQLRGKVIRLLTGGSKSKTMLHTDIDDERLDDVLDGLISEQMITRHGNSYRLS
jgi:A/G-specific adenine glycosylase